MFVRFGVNTTVSLITTTDMSLEMRLLESESLTELGHQNVDTKSLQIVQQGLGTPWESGSLELIGRGPPKNTDLHHSQRVHECVECGWLSGSECSVCQAHFTPPAAYGTFGSPAWLSSPMR